VIALVTAILLAVPVAAPACVVPSVPLPPREPALTVGPSRLIAGLYVQGGAFIVGCKQQPRGPFAGTLRVTSARTGGPVAHETLRHAGRLFRLALAPGRYTVSATSAGGLRSSPVVVTIPAHRTVRQDVFVDVP
jgi:hypothetical protein